MRDHDLNIAFGFLIGTPVLILIAVSIHMADLGKSYAATIAKEQSLCASHGMTHKRFDKVSVCVNTKGKVYFLEALENAS
jgi:hypothetical protein